MALPVARASRLAFRRLSSSSPSSSSSSFLARPLTSRPSTLPGHLLTSKRQVSSYLSAASEAKIIVKPYPEEDLDEEAGVRLQSHLGQSSSLPVLELWRRSQRASASTNVHEKAVEAYSEQEVVVNSRKRASSPSSLRTKLTITSSPLPFLPLQVPSQLELTTTPTSTHL